LIKATQTLFLLHQDLILDPDKIVREKVRVCACARVCANGGYLSHIVTRAYRVLWSTQTRNCILKKWTKTKSDLNYKSILL